MPKGGRRLSAKNDATTKNYSIGSDSKIGSDAVGEWSSCDRTRHFLAQRARDDRAPFCRQSYTSDIQGGVSAGGHATKDCRNFSAAP
jgi:hypothetical protein